MILGQLRMRARQTKNAHLMISESSGNKQSINIFFFLKIWHCLFSGIRDIYFAKPERPFLFRNCSFINAAVKYYCRCIPPLLGEFAQSWWIDVLLQLLPWHSYLSVSAKTKTGDKDKRFQQGFKIVYRTRVRSLATLVTNWLTNSLCNVK